MGKSKNMKQTAVCLQEPFYSKISCSDLNKIVYKALKELDLEKYEKKIKENKKKSKAIYLDLVTYQFIKDNNINLSNLVQDYILNNKTEGL